MMEMNYFKSYKGFTITHCTSLNLLAILFVRHAVKEEDIQYIPGNNLMFCN